MSKQESEQRIVSREIWQAQSALLVAIALQVLVWRINNELLVGPQYVIIPVEIMLSIFIGLSLVSNRWSFRRLNHTLSLGLLALISLANISSLALVLQSLIIGHSAISGAELLSSAIAIFITNIIIFSLWYWEIDSPHLTRKRWSKADKDFQFTQQDMAHEFPRWQPGFIDYLFLSVTNAVNFAPSDARPLTYAAKMLMGAQALVSVFTLALVIARSVNILGMG